MTKEYAKFEMKLPIVPAGDAKIVIDGIDITDQVKRVTIHAEAGKVTEVFVTFAAGVDLEGEAVLKLLDYTGESLVEEDTEETDA